MKPPDHSLGLSCCGTVLKLWIRSQHSSTTSLYNADMKSDCFLSSALETRSGPFSFYKQKPALLMISHDSPRFNSKGSVAFSTFERLKETL